LIKEFVNMPEFEKNWIAAGLDDHDLREFQNYLCGDLSRGSVISGTGGMRKIRWILPGKGKRGGVRIIYIDFVRFEKIYLLTVYPKSEKENLSIEERRELRELVKILESQLERKWK